MTLKIDGRTFYSTQEACKLAGTNRDTFLRWVRQNKIADVEYRDRNGWRLFTEDDLNRLKTKVNHIERMTKTPGVQTQPKSRLVQSGQNIKFGQSKRQGG